MHYTLLHSDGIVILGYFGFVLAVGLSSFQRQAHSGTDYFLAGRNLGWLSIGASMVAADVICCHVVGVIGSSGPRLPIVLESASVIALVALGWWLGPKLVSDRPSTITELFAKRYNERLRNFISGSYILVYLLIRISLVLFFASLLIQIFSPSDVNVTIAAIILIAGVYSIVGGFTAVVNTQVFQTAVMFLGLFLILLNPSWSMAIKGIASGSSLAVAGQGLNGEGSSWPAMIVGIPLFIAWLWLADQYTLQRVLGARSARDVKSGALIAIGVKVLIIIPLLWLAFSSDVESQTTTVPLQSPQLFRGIALVVIFSGVMASLSGLYNSTASLFTFDFYKRRNPSASEHKLVLVARLSTTTAVLVSMLWMPLVTAVNWSGVNCLQSLLVYFAAAIMAVYTSIFLWKNSTVLGMGSALLTGAILGCVKILAGTLATPDLIQNKLLWWLLRSSCLDFAALIFVTSLIVLVGVSLAVPSSASNVAPAPVERDL